MKNLDRAKMLKREASQLHSSLTRLHITSIQNGILDNRLVNLAEKANRRYRRRSEAEADIRWPNRIKVKK